MRFLGIDIGSRTTKLVLLEEGEIALTRVTDTTFDPLVVCDKLLQKVAYDHIVATGYGRHLLSSHRPCEVITEIKAVAEGARALLPTCRTVLDVGGQDTKAISLDAEGKLNRFAMNDRCAAGTGRFLETMATALSLSHDELIQSALLASRPEKLSSMCTVFAESEVISLIARGAAREEIALGIHESIATRALCLLKGVPVVDDVMFAGGGALNACLAAQIEKGLGMGLYRPDNPRIVAALGCALYAASKADFKSRHLTDQSRADMGEIQ